MINVPFVVRLLALIELICLTNKCLSEWKRLEERLWIIKTTENNKNTANTWVKLWMKWNKLKFLTNERM